MSCAATYAPHDVTLIPQVIDSSIWAMAEAAKHGIMARRRFLINLEPRLKDHLKRECLNR